MSTDADTILSGSDGPSATHENACLVVIRGARLGTRIPLGNAQLTIGRDYSCDFQISERNVSRAHCRLTRHSETYWLEDLGSTNRTILNGQVVENASLSDGDQLRIGSTVLKFIDAGNIEADYHLELHENAHRDALTGLYNRRHLVGMLEHEIRKRRGARMQPLALAILDIDHFKKINDELGHLGGDSALRQLTAIFTDGIASRDVLARIGGEEFALLMPEIEPEAARERLEQIRTAVADYSFEIEGQIRNLTISAGVAQWTSEMTSTSDIMRAADQSLYRAKSGGRNRVC
ncbi:MAG: GGDEF domain-containing protein [Wenzhouxiangellaceae bacterium]